MMMLLGPVDDSRLAQSLLSPLMCQCRGVAQALKAKLPSPVGINVVWDLGAPKSDNMAGDRIVPLRYLERMSL